MPSEPADPLPNGSPNALGRPAAERVLARAAELQARGGAGAEGDALSEAELLEVAREAGLDPAHVRLALAEERLRAVAPASDAAAERGLAARVAGPAVASAVRVVALPPAAALDALGRWLEREECMRVARRTADQGAWEPRRDLIGNLTRGLRTGGGTPAIRRARMVRAVALPADAGRTLLRVELDLGDARRQRVAAGAVSATGGVLAGGTMLGVGVVAHALLAVVAPLAALPVLVGAGAGWAIARGYRQTVERAHAALEQLLDRVEVEGSRNAAVGAGGPRAAALLDAIDGVRRALR